MKGIMSNQEAAMSTNPVRTDGATSDAKIKLVDMKLEVVVIPVSDVDRAKEFYGRLGWRLDAEFGRGDDFRIMQFTPPGSGCSIIFGKNATTAAAGVSCSTATACPPAPTSPISLDGVEPAVRIPRGAATARLPRSAIPTA